MGERALSKIQFGTEATRGTAVAADTMLLAAPIKIDPDRKPQYPEDMLGLRARTSRSYFYEYLVRNTLKFDAQHPLYYQALPMLFSIGLKGGVTPAEQTPSQSDFLWTHTPSLTAANAPDTITLEAGDDVQAYECEHTMIERYKISGNISQDGGDSPVTADCDFFARQWTATAFTGSLSIPSTELLNAKLARFYLDTTWAGVGTTEKVNLLRGFDIEILTGVHQVMAGSANRYFNTYAESFIEFMASFVFEGNSDADVIWDAFNAQSLAVARLTVTGALIGTGVNHKLTLDLGGTWEAVVPLDSEDRGNNLHAAVLHGKYDTTGAKLLQASVITNVAAI